MQTYYSRKKEKVRGGGKVKKKSYAKLKQMI